MTGIIPFYCHTPFSKLEPHLTATTGLLLILSFKEHVKI